LEKNPWKVFEPKRNEVTGKFKILHDLEWSHDSSVGITLGYRLDD